jgi:hypothetical protein
MILHTTGLLGILVLNFKRFSQPDNLLQRHIKPVNGGLACGNSFSWKRWLLWNGSRRFLDRCPDVTPGTWLSEFGRLWFYRELRGDR